MSRRRCFVVYLNLGDSPAGEALAVNLVIDDSGSMSGDKIAAVRTAFAELVRSLPEACQLGLVSFGSSVRLLCRPTEHRDFLLDQLELFQGGSGGTALLDALAEACQGFDEGCGKRYVLALTDGGECASQKVQDVGELVRIALETNTKMFCIGFGGDVDRDQLQAIAERTGGHYLAAAQVEDLGHRLQEALAGILEDRHRVLLRPEVTALLEESLGEVPAWWSQVSIDEWSETTLWNDGSHVRYPKPASADLPHAGAFAGMRDLVGSIFDQEIDRPARAGIRGFDPDADLIVIGWLHDPSYRALSLRVVDLFRETQARLAAALPGDTYPILVPLVRRLASQPAEAQRAMAAWLVAANTASLHRPLAVLEIDDSNHHRARNQHGYVGLSESDLLGQAATLLRALAFDPVTAQRIASQPQRGSGSMSLSAAGAVALVMPRLRFGIRSTAVSVLRQAVDGFMKPPAGTVLDSDLAKKTLASADLEPQRLRARLLGPSDRAPEASQLAEMQVSLQDFWPPPPGVAEDEYLARLPREIEEKGTYKIALRLSTLLRLLDERTKSLSERARQRVDELLDGLIVGDRSQGSKVALELLGQCHEVLVDWLHAVGSDLAGALGTDLDRLLLFTPEESGFRGSGALSFTEAMDRLTGEIENRPSGVAFFLRHALLAVALGALSHQLAPWFRGSETAPFWLAPGVALLTGAVSLVRWWHVRQRLVRAIKEACSALSRSAWELAKDHTLAAMLSLLEGMRAWVGNPHDPIEARMPAWVFDPQGAKPKRWLQGEGFDETTATRHQLVDGLETFLRQSVETLEGTTPGEKPSQNPFVWELGSTVANPSGSPPQLRLPAPVGRLAQQPGWKELARPDVGRSWREVVRRRYFDDLDRFLDHHRARLELPGRLLREAINHLTAEHAETSALSASLGALSPAEREAIVAALHAVSFPALFSEVIGDLGPPPPERRALINAAEASAAKVVGAEAVGIEPRGELHLLSTLRARITASHTWSACSSAWRAATQEARLDLLAVHGESAGPWVDPWDLQAGPTGQPEVPPPGTAPDEVDI